MRVIYGAGLLLLYSLFSAGAAWATPPAACNGQALTAGFQIVSVPNQAGGSNYPTQTALKMAVWYPSLAAPSSITYSNTNSATISGSVAQNGAVATCAQFPLVVFSHGWSGCGTQSVFLTEELARRGYIVAAPDHADHGCSVDGQGSQDFKEINGFFGFKDFVNYPVWDANEGAYRNVDIKTVLDWLLASSPWKDQINTSQIAMSGHSFGGYTSFAKIGGWKTWLDTRFKAGIMYSPFIQGFEATNTNRCCGDSTTSTVANPTVPMLFQGGTLDIGITPCVKGPQTQSNSKACPEPGQPGAFQQAQFPKYFGELGTSGGIAGHVAFSNKVCTSSPGTSPTTVQECLTKVPNAQLIVDYSEDFLDHYLQKRPVTRLFSAGDKWDTYWRTGGVPAGSYQPGLPAARMGVASIKGENLATDTVNPAGQPAMPQQIGGVTVTLDSLATGGRGGGKRGGGGPGGGGAGGGGGGTGGTSPTYNAFLYGISPAQINFVVPPETPPDTYEVTASLNGSVIASGPISVQAVSPTFFPISPGPGYSGPGFAWGWAQRQDANGTQYLPIYDNSANAPIAVNVSQGDSYLVLAATGMRNGNSPQATVGGVSVPVSAAPNPSYMGIDAVVLGPLPSSLAGKGQVNIALTIGGIQANPVAVVIQ
ncbi:MAG: hypothetical protein C5B51_29075 [Terriglobia bacterium]|nr:MAG: hypothetical protein C5B51_29075 [Terriglobia bacterium]